MLVAEDANRLRTAVVIMPPLLSYYDWCVICECGGLARRLMAVAVMAR